jgi:hypothetical protein
VIAALAARLETKIQTSRHRLVGNAYVQERAIARHRNTFANPRVMAGAVKEHTTPLARMAYQMPSTISKV